MTPAARARLSSAVSRGADAMQNFTSPLAQVFKPLAVHENMPETINPATGPAGPVAVSYGPASRRRVSSMHSTQWRHPESLVHHTQANALKRFSPKSSPVEQSALSESPDHARVVSPLTERKPSLDTEYVGSDWTSRMDQMEKRQQRIEDLLIQLSKDIRKLET
jgi:hypothetical protein